MLTFLESLGRVIAGPLLAYILRIGRDESGRPTGLVFLVAAVSCFSFPALPRLPPLPPYGSFIQGWVIEQS